LNAELSPNLVAIFNKKDALEIDASFLTGPLKALITGQNWGVPVGDAVGLSAGLGSVVGLSLGDGVSFLSFFFFSLGVVVGVGVAIGSRDDCFVLAAPASMPDRMNVPAAAEIITFLIMKPP